MLAILVVAIIGVITLWFYGSFWTTAFFIILGGDLCALLFTFEHFLSVLMCPFSMVVGYTCYTESLFLFEISGLTFMLSHERVALLITTVYSVYCARLYAGWLGLLLAFNLALILRRKKLVLNFDRCQIGLSSGPKIPHPFKPAD